MKFFINLLNFVYSKPYKIYFSLDSTLLFGIYQNKLRYDPTFATTYLASTRRNPERRVDVQTCSFFAERLSLPLSHATIILEVWINSDVQLILGGGRADVPPVGQFFPSLLSGGRNPVSGGELSF